MACRSLEKANNAMSEIKAAGIKGHISTVQMEVTDQSSIEQAAAHVRQQFGRLDVLVSNAASGCRDPDVKTRFRLCMDTNVVGPAVIAETFRPLLLKSEKPYSLYVSSGLGTIPWASDPNARLSRGIANGGAYQASKAALNMIAIRESIEFSDTALKVFAVSPGFVRSNLRGPSEEEISGWGGAGDATVSGELILSIIQGNRDADAGKLVAKDYVYPHGDRKVSS
ncbi:hypothetical protein MMC20_006233 [Loxospora ochrophaea]|nr:hypothetical protein [Loxospora ochrophaea]